MFKGWCRIDFNKAQFYKEPALISNLKRSLNVSESRPRPINVIAILVSGEGDHNLESATKACSNHYREGG